MLGALAIGASSLASAVCGEHLSYSVERVPTLPSSVAQRVALRLDAAAPASIEVTALRGTDARGRRHAAAAAALPTLAPGATATVDLLALRPNQVRAAPPPPSCAPAPSARALLVLTDPHPLSPDLQLCAHDRRGVRARPCVRHLDAGART